MKLGLLVFLFVMSVGLLTNAFAEESIGPTGSRYNPEYIYELEQNIDHLNDARTVETLQLSGSVLKRLNKKQDPNSAENCLDCKKSDSKSEGNYIESFENSSDPNNPRFCKAERTYFDSIIRSTRASDPKNPYLDYLKTAPSEQKLSSGITPIPRKCLTYIMDSFIAPSFDDKSDSLAFCASKNGTPLQGMHKACITEELVNVTYNIFNDVSDCLDVDQYAAVPKLMNESGFLFNTFNSLKIFDPRSKYYRNIMDLRVCVKEGVEKIKSFDELVPCDPKKRKLYLSKEAGLISALRAGDENSNIKTVKALKALRDGTHDGSYHGKKLRDVYDFDSANWIQELERKLASRSKYSAEGTLTKLGDCAKYFLEVFCDHPFSVMGGDAGIGQFTAPAAQEVMTFSQRKSENKPLSEIDKIKSSPKTSCQRLAKIPGIMEDLEEKDCETNQPGCFSKSSLQRRCEYIVAPPNPALALIKYGLLMKSIKISVESEWKKQKIAALKKDAHLTVQEDLLKEALVTLSYNQGPTTAVTYFKTWLTSRIAKGDATGNFDAYLKKHVKAGANNYLSAIRSRAHTLDKQLGKEVCTKRNFLSVH